LVVSVKQAGGRMERWNEGKMEEFESGRVGEREKDGRME